MAQAHRAYCVRLADLEPVETPPPGVASLCGHEVCLPTESALAALRHHLASYSRHWGGITVADFAQKQALWIFDPQSDAEGHRETMSDQNIGDF